MRNIVADVLTIAGVTLAATASVIVFGIGGLIVAGIGLVYIGSKVAE
jgi:hypothetical protein